VPEAVPQPPLAWLAQLGPAEITPRRLRGHALLVQRIDGAGRRVLRLRQRGHDQAAFFFQGGVTAPTMFGIADCSSVDLFPAVTVNAAAGTVAFQRRFQSPLEVETTRARDRDIAVYVQDNWKPSQRLTLNFGVRADFVRRFEERTGRSTAAWELRTQARGINDRARSGVDSPHAAAVSPGA
jgi:outer membrane receptor protein involved in Fe transport